MLSNCQNRAGGATRGSGSVDRPCRSVPVVYSCRSFVNEPARLHRYDNIMSRYGLEVGSKSTTPLYPEIRQMDDPVELE
jgi:hypothetical protein